MKKRKFFNMMKIVAGISFMLAIVLVHYIFSSKNALDGTFWHTYLPLITLVICLIAFIYSFIFVTKQEWDDLYSPEDCKQMAEDVKFGKRKWFGKCKRLRFLLMPLYPEKLNELGGGIKFSLDQEEVREYLDDGLVENHKMVRDILNHC